MKKVILTDFDGVIHDADKGHLDGVIYGKPMKGALFTINNLIKEGYIPKVFTARKESDFDSIKTWLKDNNFPDLEVTNIKEPAHMYIDNRAVRFVSWADVAYYLL